MHDRIELLAQHGADGVAISAGDSWVAHLVEQRLKQVIIAAVDQGYRALHQRSRRARRARRSRRRR